MSKHTPGPWQVTPDKTRVQTGEDVADYQIADCEDTHFAPPFDQCEANARLIASAPELLEACKNLIASYEFHCPEAKKHSNAIKFAKQTIAKTEGK